METCLGPNKNASKHTITVEGKPISEYVNSNKETLVEYSYQNCISANIIETVDCDENTTMIPNKDGSTCDPYNIIIHATYDEETDSVEYFPDVTTYFFKNDGWYRFTHLIIPTKKYYVNLGFDGQVDVEQLKNDLTDRFGDCEIPDRIVVFDTEKYCFLLGELFRYQIFTKDQDNNGQYSFETHYEWRQITFDEVLCIAKSDLTSTIKCYSQDFVNYSYLEEAYINKANDLLKVYQNGICQQNCSDFSKANQSDIQLRDYYWMALNAVKYATELCNYCKAIQLLNCVSQCGSLKDGSNEYCFNLSSENGCGCS